MRLIVLVLISLMVGSTFVNGQDVRPAEPQKAKDPRQNIAAQVPENPNAPVIEFDKTVHDYGQVVQHGDGTCEFVFTNNGKEPLILSNVRSSCGCTVPQWPKQPVLPGASEKIKVAYDTKRVGPINKTVTVTSNAKTPTVVLKIQGNVIAQAAAATPEKHMEGSGAPVNR